MRSIGWNGFCQSCLQSALSPAEGTLSESSPEPTRPDLTSIPAGLHNLAGVLNKDSALSLPPHRPYSSALDLLPGASFPGHGEIY